MGCVCLCASVCVCVGGLTLNQSHKETEALLPCVCVCGGGGCRQVAQARKRRRTGFEGAQGGAGGAEELWRHPRPCTPSTRLAAAARGQRHVWICAGRWPANPTACTPILPPATPTTTLLPPPLPARLLVPPRRPGSAARAGRLLRAGGAVPQQLAGRPRGGRGAEAAAQSPPEAPQPARSGVSGGAEAEVGAAPLLALRPALLTRTRAPSHARMQCVNAPNYHTLSFASPSPPTTSPSPGGDIYRRRRSPCCSATPRPTSHKYYRSQLTPLPALPVSLVWV